jgi:hypothetical protein
LNAVRRPRNAIARAALRQACLDGQAHLSALMAARRAEALAPRDRRPEPPLPEAAPAIAEPAAATVFKARLPYPEDD